ncbi:MAG: hypothetical protein B6D58_02650 [candidate division Zixibacteria bacterium 4484_95]|nr:MAG: hypothetical protein B6D58_02650 [candidate division Zixibacteria bacterium 4484_95]RKX19634.1 MAG: hypothetical protein DRP26_03115 [candidate division Zixibacteria bacterium]
MDKRSLIGFLLILIILVLWPYWNKLFLPQQEETSPQQQEETTVRPEKHDTLYQEPVGAYQKHIKPQVEISHPVGKPDIPEKLINVETEDFIAVFSSYGGLLKSIQLKKYFIENGPAGDSLVHLIGPPQSSPWQAMGALTLSVEDSLHYINYLPFTVDGGDIYLTDGDEPKSLSFIYDNPDGASIIKEYTFMPTGYDFKFSLTINDPPAFGFVDKLTIGWLMPSIPTEKNLKDDLDKFAAFSNMAGEVEEFKKLEKGKLHRSLTGNNLWVAVRSKYFTNIIISDDKQGDEILIVGNESSITDINSKQHKWKKFGVGMTFKLDDNSYSNNFTIYTGPLDYQILQKMGHNLGKLVDMGWSVFRPFAIAILWIFIQFHKFLLNYGLVIIIFSILMKVVFWPLTRKSATSMHKMKELQPKIQEIKAKYKDDPQRLNTETMRLYKEYGVNPFGSCLPLFIQMPIFISMWAVLRNSIELRAAEFVFWITDLSQKDQYYVLPIVMGISMFFQQKMTITDPKQKMMIYLMPVFFTIFFAGLPSGLILYWTVFNVAGIFEQLRIKRKMEAEKKANA